MPELRSKDPRKTLIRALQMHNVPAMEKCWRQDPTLLNGNEAERTELVIAALGTGATQRTVAEQRAGWAWLDEHGFQWPSAADKQAEIWGRLLEMDSVEMLDAWKARTPDTPVPQSGLRRLFFSKTVDKLAWWVRQGLPLEFEKEGDLVRDPPVFYALSAQELRHTGAVLFLLDQGLPPAPVNRLYPEHLADTPLLFLARRYGEQIEYNTLPSEGDANFRILWEALVKAGDDPAFCNEKGESPQALIMETPARDWWEARLRRDHLLQPDMAPVAPARRRRHRA